MKRTLIQLSMILAMLAMLGSWLYPIFRRQYSLAVNSELVR